MRAQLQIGESMMVMIILMILGVIALVFYFNMAQEDYQVKIRQYDDLNTLETAQVVAKLNEISCAKPGVRSVCVDLYKAQAVAELQGTNEGKDYFRYLFRNSRIAITSIYPAGVELVLYENTISEARTTNMISLPVIIHDSASDENNFGILTVQRYFG